MKKYLATLILIAVTLAVSAQPLGPAYVVYFTDKANSPYSIDNPAEFLSEAAIDRRMRQNIPIQEDDIPVNTTYLNAISNAGAQIAAVSRWFNLAAVWIQNPSVAQSISNLPFVSSVVPMGGSNKVNWKNNTFFDFEEYDFRDIPNIPKLTTNDYYNYGSAANQILMVKGNHLHNQGYRGEGMVIAVLDAGFANVDVIPAFDDLRANNRILGTRDFVNPGNNVYQSSIHPHGTMVLSIMGAYLPGQMIGTAPEASYWLLRTEDANGPPGNSEYLMEEYFWITGAEFADSVGAWVINSSLGYTTFDNPAQNHTYQDLDGNTTPITRGAERAASKGILVVNSAGNSGGSPWQFIGAPADGHLVMAVGAVNSMGNYASFSSTGPSADGRIKPDIAAQGAGTAIVGSSGNVGSGSGTSFSSPLLAGVAACLWQINQDIPRNGIYEAIIQSGSQYLNPDNFLGYGIPDFELAQIKLLTNTNIRSKSNQVKVYPNPSSGILVLETLSQTNMIHGFTIFDISGRICYSVDFSNHPKTIVTKNISALEKGFYLLRINLGVTTETFQIVRQ